MDSGNKAADWCVIVLVSGQQWVSIIISYSLPVSLLSPQRGRGPSPLVCTRLHSSLCCQASRHRVTACLTRSVSWWKDEQKGRGSGREEAGSGKQCVLFFQRRCRQMCRSTELFASSTAFTHGLRFRQIYSRRGRREEEKYSRVSLLLNHRHYNTAELSVFYMAVTQSYIRVLCWGLSELFCLQPKAMNHHIQILTLKDFLPK